jgi:hypothetical protein
MTRFSQAALKIMPKPISIITLFILFAQLLPGSAEPLTGGVSKSEFQQEGTDMPPVPEQKQADGSAVIERPLWIPLNAYSNEEMVCKYGTTIPFLRFGQAIPPNGIDVRMQKTVSRYWGDGTYGVCTVHCSPIYDHPGNFTFYTINRFTHLREKDGPRGWLQDTGNKTTDRWREYRCWFDR